MTRTSQLRSAAFNHLAQGRLRTARWCRATARRHPGVTFVALPCAVLALAVLALWPTGQSAGPPAPAAPTTATGVALVAQDRPAPDFTRPLVIGSGTLSLHQFRGKVVVVNFWASWCTPCRNEVPRLRALANQQREVVFVGVDAQDSRSGGQDFIQRLQPGYRSVSDPGGSLLRAFGSIGLPSTFIIDRGGRIQFQAFGAFDPKAFSSALARVAG